MVQLKIRSQINETVDKDPDVKTTSGAPAEGSLRCGMGI